MHHDTRSEYVTRESVLKLLSNDEIARVSTAESEARLENGDEYLDLEALDQGVQWAPAEGKPMGHLLPRKAVHERTWSSIMSHLSSAAGARAPVGR